jgi:putative glutathione S-transferase
MGLLIDGVWQENDVETKESGGRFISQEAQFRNWVTADGSAGPTGKGGFKVGMSRYSIFASSLFGSLTFCSLFARFLLALC